MFKVCHGLVEFVFVVLHIRAQNRGAISTVLLSRSSLFQ